MDEYIKREDAINAITWNGLSEPPEIIHLTLLTAQKNIRKISTADVVPKKEGKWEKRIFIIFDSEKVGYHCSMCNTTWDTETNFCPYCGAHMSGGKE